MTSGPLPRFAGEALPALLFRGKPSQTIHLPRAALTLLLLIMGMAAALTWVLPWWLPPLPGFIASLALGWRVLHTACTTVVIDEERLTLLEGVLTKTTSSVELFRMLDVTLVQPWWHRCFGIGRLIIHTADASHPRLVLDGLITPEWLRDTLNRAAIDLRQRKRMLELTVA